MVKIVNFFFSILPVRACECMLSHAQHSHVCDPMDCSPSGSSVHDILQVRILESKSEVAQPCPTLSDPMDCSPPSFSIHGIFQARILEWVAIAFSKDSKFYVYFTITRKKTLL